jgi:5-methylcytosine-specific restriction protein A
VARVTPLRRTALVRRTELRRTPLVAKKQLQRRTAMARTVGKQRKQRDTGPTQATKVLLWARANGRCELCGRDLEHGFPFSRHHRRPRGSGGSTVSWINDVTNLLLLCGSATTPDGCHLLVEKHRDHAKALGWLIPYSSPYTPAELPVSLEPGRGLVYLTADGGYAKGAA